MKNYHINLLLVILLSIGLCSCSKSDRNRIALKSKYSQNPNDYPKTLFIYTKATNVVYYEAGGCKQVSYNVEELYPAFQFLSNLTTNLNNMGYKYLNGDYLNPGITNLENTWRIFDDESQQPKVKVKQLIEDWQGQDKSIVRFMIIYKSLFNNPENNTNLNVVIIHIPAPIVNLQKEAIQKQLNTVKP